MSILSVKNVSHDFGGREILNDASFKLLKGEHVGLVGANGEGKTTFLRIITGDLMPDAGEIEWCKRITTGYLDQHAELGKGVSIRDTLRTAFDNMYNLEKDMLKLYEDMAEAKDEDVEKMMEDAAEIQEELDFSGFYTIDSKIETVANGLGFGEIGLEKKVDELSGGQRTKVLLAKLLLEAPIILILDEPTNYLDVNHIEWLKRYLISYENAFIIVSHEISFLNEVTNVTYNIEESKLTRYSGNYDFFMISHDAKKKQIEAAYEKQKKEIKKLEVFVAKNKARAATANMAKSRQKKLDRIDRVEIAREKIKPEFEFPSTRASSRYVFTAKDLVIGYDEPLTKQINVEVEYGQKIAIKGVNGLGKSTLLKTLLGLIKPVSGEVIKGDYLATGFFEQESIEDDGKTALEEIWDMFPSMTNKEVRQVLAKCGLTNEHITSRLKVLSGGENAKVRICKLMLQESNLLVLDEPTNHLDVDAKASLSDALRKFKGTIILVSHDPEFYENVVTDVWDVSDWTNKII